MMPRRIPPADDPRGTRGVAATRFPDAASPRPAPDASTAPPQRPSTTVSVPPRPVGARRYGLAKKTAPVTGTRTVAKKDMVLNDATPTITVDPESFTVVADGETLTCDPASELPLARNYFLF